MRCWCCSSKQHVFAVVIEVIQLPVGLNVAAVQAPSLSAGSAATFHFSIHFSIQSMAPAALCICAPLPIAVCQTVSLMCVDRCSGRLLHTAVAQVRALAVLPGCQHGSPNRYCCNLVLLAVCCVCLCSRCVPCACLWTCCCSGCPR